MSSLDSVINSLSATTMEDFVRRFHTGTWSDARELWLSRWLTVFWGVVTLGMSFFVGDIAPTVLEAINKIGSLANGPILAVFVLGFFVSRVTGWLAIPGLLAGMVFNGWCWLALPEVSWLWWNLIGCVVAVTGRDKDTQIGKTSTTIERYVRVLIIAPWIRTLVGPDIRPTPFIENGHCSS